MSMFSRALGGQQERLLRDQPDGGAEVRVADLLGSGMPSISMRPACGA